MLPYVDSHLKPFPFIDNTYAWIAVAIISLDCKIFNYLFDSITMFSMPKPEQISNNSYPNITHIDFYASLLRFYCIDSVYKEAHYVADLARCEQEINAAKHYLKDIPAADATSIVRTLV